MSRGDKPGIPDIRACPFCGTDVTGETGYRFLTAHLETCEAFQDELGGSPFDEDTDVTA